VAGADGGSPAETPEKGALVGGAQPHEPTWRAHGWLGRLLTTIEGGSLGGTMKFPSQNKLLYATSAISNGNFAECNNICLPKDLSILNRRGYASTKKGVPWVFTVRATVYPCGLDGSGYVSDYDTDVRTVVKFLGCQNTWVYKNAAVKLHHAFLSQLRKAGIKKSQRGAYSAEIRYGYDERDTTWSVPVDGVGDAFEGGTWDHTDFATEDDDDFGYSLCGAATTEESSINLSVQNLAYSYLVSRSTVPADSNLESGNIPTKWSIMNGMLDNSESYAVKDDIIEDVRDSQDNPPYDEMLAANVNNDAVEESELGRIVTTPSATQTQSVILDVPFGMMRVLASHQDPGNNSGVVDDLSIGLEVLAISPMQG
jgi:hypothetical protein